MHNARLAVLIIGVLLPYLARLLKGIDGLLQYTSAGLGGLMLLCGFNAVAWGSVLAISFFYHRPLSLLAPALAGFAYIAWAHYQLDLAADAQSSIGIIFIPIYALLPIVVGGVVGYGLDRYWRRGV
ncbi:MAG: hypothetical protein AAGC84_08820 [Pseudomonas sp.]